MLITCPECSNQISNRAVNCPECGYPFQEFSHAVNQQVIINSTRPLAPAKYFCRIFLVGILILWWILILWCININKIRPRSYQKASILCVGSLKEEVLNNCGMPNTSTESKWSYSDGDLYFEDGRVIKYSATNSK